MNILETGNFHHKDPFGEPRWDADFPGYLKGRCEFCLSGDFVVGEYERCAKKALETGNSLHKGPDGKPEEEYFYRGL